MTAHTGAGMDSTRLAKNCWLMLSQHDSVFFPFWLYCLLSVLLLLCSCNILMLLQQTHFSICRELKDFRFWFDSVLRSFLSCHRMLGFLSSSSDRIMTPNTPQSTARNSWNVETTKDCHGLSSTITWPHHLTTSGALWNTCQILPG